LTLSYLQTIRTGPETGTPALILHDRYGHLEDAEALGALFGDDTIKIAVRSPRAQSAGGSGITMGYFWYIGPKNQPELSTLGDGLYQLEVLIEETLQRYGQRKIVLAGQGEGAMIAILAGLVFPDKIKAVIASDAVFPTNIDDMPLECPPANGLPILVSGEDAQGAADALNARGASCEIISDSLSADVVSAFLAKHA
jgi:pimeloyl-ACP methyl ester carboxylesterase